MMVRSAYGRPTCLALVAGSALALAACGGSSGSGSSGSDSGTGSLTLDITDAPVDSATEVNVVFTGITLKRQNGERITFACNEPADDPIFSCGEDGTRTIDMLALTGDESENLLDDVEVDAGRYDWIRLLVDAGTPAQPDSGTSTIVFDDGSVENLIIPSGSQSGLKLVSGFDVPVNGAASFTIDFDLRKAITQSSVGGGSERYKMRPAFRLVDNNEVGHLVGSISNEFVQEQCETADNGLAVYLFEGHDAEPQDIFVEDDSDTRPVTTTLAKEPEEGAEDSSYSYHIGFLKPGDYTAAVTCDANDDDPDADDELDFPAAANVTITAGPPPTEQNFD